MKHTLYLAFSLIFMTLSAQQPVTVKREQDFKLGSTIEITSPILAENRVLNIYLPEGYTGNDSLRYPVIYLLDGSADEDFIHVSGLVQYANFPWVNLLPQSIVVGIANVDRKRDFTFPTTIAKDKADYPTTGGSEKFIAFIEKELQPFIDATYRTNSAKMLVGQSLGGLLATEILFKKPQLFNQYVIISPSLWWDKESLLKIQPAFQGKASNPFIPVFVGVGREGKIMEKDAKTLFKLLKKEGLDTKFEFFGNENHATIFHQALYEAFEFMGKN